MHSPMGKCCGRQTERLHQEGTLGPSNSVSHGGGSSPVPTCPAACPGLAVQLSGAPPPAPRSLGRNWKPELLGLDPPAASAPPLPGDPLPRSAAGGARVTVWAVVGLEGGRTELGRPSHCSPRPCPFHPQTSCGSAACPQPQSAAVRGRGGGSRLRRPWRACLEQREEGMGAGRYLCSPSHPTPGPPGVSVVNPAFFLQFLWPTSGHC